MSKVLIICEFSVLNGGERSLLACLEPLAAEGWQPHIACPPGPLAEAVAATGCPTVTLDELPSGAQRLAAGRTRLERAMRSLHPQLVHANSLSMARLLGPVAQHTGIPGIGHLRDAMRLNRTAIADVCGNKRLLAVSRATGDWHVQQGVPQDLLRVLYNGITIRHTPPSDRFRHERSIPSTSPIVGGVGQISLRKGWDVWLNAATHIAQALPECHFAHIGARHATKPETRAVEATLREAARAGPLSGRLHLLGPRNDVLEILPEWNVLLHAARQEPLGRVLLEAGSCNVPVVATDAGGTREIFADGSLCRLASIDDAEQLADHAIELLTHPVTAAQMALSAREHISLAFTTEATTRGLIENYQSVLEPG